MSMDPNASEHFAPQMPPPAKGGSKVWLFLGLGCGAMLLLCCGGGVAIFFFAKSAVQVVADPAAIQQQANQIADFDLPAGFKAQTGIGVKNPLTGQAVVTIVVYTGPNHEPGIFLMEFGQMIASGDPEQLKMQMELQMRQQGQQMKRLNVAESRDVELQIRGKSATFKIQKAEDPQTKQQFVQVEGIFEGKQGPAMVVGQFSADGFTEDDAEKFVRSIK
ncbi:MAG TPA: hypothetical protein VG125_12555 [Pirellulales bacterium]|jgi:hypothetical protein|nr:hypothetical protein [Pirellulales bacterium]